MKFEFDESDLKRIKNINDDLKEGKEPMLLVYNEGKDYFINFSCVDVAKANNFIGMLLCPNKEIQNDIEEKFGIRINSLNFCEGDTKISTLKEYLKKFIEDLDTIR